MALQFADLGIIAATVQSMLYGFALLLFILTTWILLQDRRRRRVNQSMIAASFTLIILATLELACNILRLRKGFLGEGASHYGGIEGYFADVSEPTYIVKGALYNVQTLILDAVVIYRVHVVWQKWCIVLVPGLGWCALLACTIGLNHAFATVPEYTDNVFDAKTGGWITAVYATTLATNVTATSLLAYRIGRVNRRAGQFVPSERLAVILRVVIESGTLYSLTIVAALITFVAGSRVVYVLLDLISPIISIVFNMIIVRVGLFTNRPGLSAIGIEDDGNNSDLEFAATNATGPRIPTFQTNRNSGLELKSMTVDLAACRDVENTSVDDRDNKQGTLGTPSTDSVPRRSRCSL